MKNLLLLFFLQVIFLSNINAQCISGDCENGTGIFLYPSGAKYIGQFQNGEIHGVGACYYTDGTTYKGNWVHRYPEGKGSLTHHDGSKWTGQWKRGHPVNENGEIIEELFPDKEIAIEEDNIQVGCLAGDCKNGEGVFAYADGSKYDGHFVNGMLEGEGTFYFTDGSKYAGGFLDGLLHGKGVLYIKDGTSKIGEWQEGEFMGTPIIDNGQIGCIVGDCQNGRGTYVYPDGAAKYVGQFQNGSPEGRGAAYYANGEKYVGDWILGSYHGNGSLFLTDGTEVSGLWENGTFMGKGNLAIRSGRNSEIVITKKDDKQIDNEEVVVDEELSKSPTPEQIEDVASIESKKGVEDVTEPEETFSAEKISRARNIGNFKVWAVIIGVSHYNHMPVLRYTDDDAYRLYAHMKSPEGGALPDDQIRVLIDEEATRQNIENTMREVFGKAGPDDLIVLYFSGHGLKGSFLPYDYDGYNNKLIHQDINAILDDSPAKFKFVIADACHSGGLLAMKSGEVTNALEHFYTSLAQSNPGTAMLMSSKSDETSLESSGLRHGVFSHFLIRGLKGEADVDVNKIISVQEIFNFINTHVRDYTGNRQSPLLKGDYDPSMPVGVIR